MSTENVGDSSECDAHVQQDAKRRKKTEMSEDHLNIQLTEVNPEDVDDNESIGDDQAASIGIDLGTTFSCVAAIVDGEPKVLIDPRTGSHLIPSYVAFTDKNTCLIGQPAKDQAHLNAKNTIFNAKRFIGRPFDDEKLQDEMKLLPFRVIGNQRVGTSVELDFQGTTKWVSVIEIAAMILSQLKRTAEQQIGPVSDAVITVPANFNTVQREATKAAGRIAGLNVLRILNEPTAAAIAYSLDRSENQKEERTVCVYDLGGGTFDVTILTFKPTGAIRIRSTAGDSHLGGEDIDYLLVEAIINSMKKLESMENFEFTDEIKHRIRLAAIETKHKLSSATEAKIQIDNITGGVNYVSKITLSTLESLMANTIQKTMATVQEAIDRAKDLENGANDIKEVVLVGGSSRIPIVKRLLEAKFPHATVHSSKDPDTVVAIGASIQCAISNGTRSGKLTNILLWDVTPLSLGIRGSNGRMIVIIPRGSKLPAEDLQAFPTKYDNQRSVKFDVYEGEDKVAIHNNLIGSISIDNIPPGSRILKRLYVNFHVDKNGIMSVTTQIHGQNEQIKTTINYSAGRLDDFEIERMIQNTKLVD